MTSIAMAMGMASSNTIKVGLSVSPLHLQFRPPLIKCSSLSFQDFQGYAKPSRLLPTKHLKLRDEPADNIISALQSDASISLYRLLLCTSSFSGSDLSDPRAALLVCIIDQYGDSFLERIPSIHCPDKYDGDVFRFQRGSKDEFVFWGPKLARIQSIWISPDSGSWRLGGASLTIISVHDHQEEEFSPNGSMYQRTTYYFEVDDDVLLGEGSELSMLELCPCVVTEHNGDDSISNIYENFAQGGSLAEKEIAKEKNLREYANLKYSLLLYDSVLVFAGTSIASITGDENTALAFLTGGIGGFLYLLLLQRSVDTLQAPEVNVPSTGNSFNSLFRGVKGPIVVFTFAFVVAVLATKYDEPYVIAALTPKGILAGLTGFLACKISVVLAAFKPVSKGLEDNK